MPEGESVENKVGKGSRRSEAHRTGPGKPAHRGGMAKMTAAFNLALAGLVLGATVAQAAVLESPARGAALSGLGFISGWKCDASAITVTMNGGRRLSVAMHQERGDLRAACGGTIRHGFIMQMNWNLVGDGEHEVVAYDAGVAFAWATFTVGTTGEEFVKDVTRRTVLDGFPAPGERALLEWNESTQHFEIVTVWGMPLDSEYDRSFWRRYVEGQAAGAFTTDEELYAELPNRDACFAGRLSQDAKNRALEAANQIRALHGLPALRSSILYRQQVQAAALQGTATGGIPSYFPPTDSMCCSAEGAAGSRSSNLFTGAGNRDPASHMVGWANDFNDTEVVAAAAHRRWLLNPFATYTSYGQVYGYGALKVMGFLQEPALPLRTEADFLACPYEVYPFPLLQGDPPWSFSVIVDPDDLWANQGDYFREAIITVTRAKDETALPITDRYTDSIGYGIPNFLSWQVEGWEYDTLYEVEIANVIFSDGLGDSYSYSVFIERQNLEE